MRHLYDSVKDFSTLLREIRKVDSEVSSSKPFKKQAAQQQLSGQVSTDDTSSQLAVETDDLVDGEDEKDGGQNRRAE